MTIAAIALCFALAGATGKKPVELTPKEKLTIEEKVKKQLSATCKIETETITLIDGSFSYLEVSGKYAHLIRKILWQEFKKNTRTKIPERKLLDNLSQIDLKSLQFIICGSKLLPWNWNRKKYQEKLKAVKPAVKKWCEEEIAKLNRPE